MPARTDHDRRDAQHAARASIAIAMGRYIRRITEEAYAHIESVSAERDGGDVDWSAVGASAANRALASYGVAVPTAALDADAISVSIGDTAALDAPRS